MTYMSRSMPLDRWVSQPATAKLSIAGDNHYVTEGVRSTLETWGYGVVDRSGSAQATREAICRSDASVFIFCFNDGRVGLGLYRTLRKICDPRPAILLLQPGDRKSILEAVRLNVNGVASTEAPPATLLQCVEAVGAGRNWVDPGLLRHALLTRTGDGADARSVQRSRTSAAEELTARQEEILALAREGFSDAEIGRKLAISRKTVTMHVGRICQRLCLPSRKDLRTYRTTTERFTGDVARTTNLSGREADVLKLVLEGRRAREIGSALGVSEATVRTFLQRIRAKTGITDTSELLEMYSATVGEVGAHLQRALISGKATAAGESSSR